MLALLLQILPISAGLLLITSFIWLAGPYFGIGNARPLESVMARIIATALVFAVWGAWWLFKRLRARRASDNLVAAVVKQSQETPRPSADAVQLRERFEEAVATLKQKRRSGNTLYDLPWYVIIGAPGSGKTTALVNSGLHFPLEQRSGRGALRGVGGTRNCDWWFTDEAVFLDTAGRYTTQDSDADADSAGWKAFLTLLRKYRKRRPVNGIILTISAQDLMQGHGTAEGHVDAARRRLNELNDELHIQLPVYLMVTKCDLVAGFTEYFDDLAQEGRAQVWGVTFPFEETLKGSAGQLFPAEFDALITRLNERVLARVEEDRDVRRRTAIFGFPQQMASLRGALVQFIADVFTSTRFDRQVLLRGVYFTSGTQEGTPIDRLLGSIGRRFGVAADAVMPPQGRGKAYFIERLLKEVLLGESGLAGVNRRFEVQKAAAELGAYAAMALVAVLGVIIWTVSYNRNRSYVDEVGADVAKLAEVPPVTGASSLDAALPRLDRVRQVVQSADRYPDGAPWSMWWGLYQGNSLGDAARDAYSRELDGAMLAHVADRFRQRLIEYASAPENLYPYLKGYLMLGQPEHLDRKEIEYLANLEWESAYGADPDRLASVKQHFRSLLEYNESLPAVVLDEAIVTQARNTLRQASPAGLVYRYVQIGYANDTARALRLDLAAGLGAEKVLRRRSRTSLAEPIPSIYTKPVFEEITSKGTDSIVKQFTDEFWVWGDARPAVAASATLSAEFLDIYEKDYIKAWDRIVNDIQAAPLSSLSDTKEALAILSGPTSPLRGLLKAVDDNTYLEKPAEPGKPGIVGGIGAGFGGLIDTVKGRAGIPKVVPGAQITAHFAQIHSLLAGEKGSAPIDAILQTLRQLQQKMEPVGGGIGQKDPGDPQAMRAVGESAEQLRREAAPLPPSIVGVVNEVANGAARAVRGEAQGTLERRYEEDVAKECRAIVSGKYPFVAGGPDVPLADFGRLFGSGGIYESFFKAELADKVDTSRSQWVWRTDASGAAIGPAAMLRPFEAAQQIRVMFFRPGSQLPEVRFALLQPESLEGGALRFTLELDGQSFQYRHQAMPAKSVAWPGPSPGVASATFEERTGGATTLGFEGAWAWFRLLDVSQTQRQSDARYVLTFEKGSHSAKVPIEANSIRNPFGERQILQQFRCG